MTIALIAGTGGLPPHLAGSLMVQGRTPIICEMRGFPSEIKGKFERIGFRIETLGTFLETLKPLGVTEVCMAGAVQRPDVDPNAIDPATAPLVPRLMAAMAKGDDGTLREIVAIFEEHGFAVVGAHEVAPDLLPDAGSQTTISPQNISNMLNCARRELAAMGSADMGQALVLRGEDVIAREDERGTAAMLHDVKNARHAVLFKAPKPNQTLLADMPMIGLDTAQQAEKAGLEGIVIAHRGVMVLDLPAVVSFLNAHDMYLWVTP